MKRICSLCRSEGEIKLSHIIPKFVSDWIIDTSPGYLRCAKNPNLRIQDGIKLDLLCENCEQRLSKWEKAFAENIFKPLHKHHSEMSIFPCEEWALKFAVSVSWRVLVHFKQLGLLSHFSEIQQADADKALNMWSEFMLDHRDHLGPHEQHMVFFDVIEFNTLTDLSPYMNRYLLRTFDMDVICSENSTLVYSKMGRIGLFGVIRDDNIKYWRGTRIDMNGFLGDTNYFLPKEIYDYINDRSNKVAQSLSEISQKQRSKIHSLLQKELQERPDELANTEAFIAMVHDVKTSGKKAFKVTEPPNSSKK